MPITIGSQNDVPSSGDPIVSPWYQDTSRKLVHTFASVAARDAWVSPPDGAMAYTTNTNQLWNRQDATWREVQTTVSADNRYVELAGDVMTGSLTLSTVGTGVDLAAGEPSANQRAPRKDWVDTQVATRLALAGGTMSGTLFVGANPATGLGVSANVAGQISSTVGSGSATADPSLNLNRNGTGAGQPGAVSGVLARFLVNNSTTAGTITIASTTSCAYNTTSDPRFKHRSGDAAGALDVAATLGAAAFRGYWLDETGEPSGEEWVFLSSHDIETAAPYAVTGDRDAVTATGAIEPQQVNYPALVPLLFAALAQAVARIEALEGGTVYTPEEPETPDTPDPDTPDE